MALKQPSLLVLLHATLALNAGIFIVIPLLPVHATATLGLSAAIAGLVLAVRQFVQNAPTVVGGAIADRFGHRSQRQRPQMGDTMLEEALLLPDDFPGHLDDRAGALVERLDQPVGIGQAFGQPGRGLLVLRAGSGAIRDRALP